MGSEMCIRDSLGDVVHAHDYKHPSDPALSMPAVLINQEKEQVLWGLSLRMLAILYDGLDKPLTVLNEQQQQELRAIESRELSPKSVQDSMARRVENSDREKLDSITKKLIERSKKDGCD